MTACTRRRSLEAAGVAAAMPVFDALAGQVPATPGAITVEKDVVFGKGGTIDLRRDLYRPRPARANAPQRLVERML